MKRQIKGIISLAVAICMSAVGVVSVRADSLNLDNEMSVKVTVPANTGVAEQLAEAEKAGEGKLVYDLYRIADVTNDGGFDLDVLEAYTAYESDIEAAAEIVKDQTDEQAAAKWKVVAQELAAKVLGKAGDPVNALNPDETAGYVGLSLGTEQTIADPGIYLLVARSSEDNATVVKSVTQTGTNTEETTEGKTTAVSSLVTYTVINNYTYTIQPQLISIPTTTTLNTTTGEWVYKQEIDLKLETAPATGSIEIDKTLTGYYDGAENATFVFQVDTYDPDDDTKLYSSEVYAMTFTEESTQSVTVEGLPIGATVKVSEIYSGTNYQCTVDSPVTLVVTDDAENPEKASFTNESNGNRNGGGGVTNYFVYEKQADGSLGWSWEQHADGNISTTNGLTDKLLQQIMSSSEQTEGSAE